VYLDKITVSANRALSVNKGTGKTTPLMVQKADGGYGTLYRIANGGGGGTTILAETIRGPPTLTETETKGNSNAHRFETASHSGAVRYGYDSTDAAAVHHRLHTLQRDWVIYVTDLRQVSVRVRGESHATCGQLYCIHMKACECPHGGRPAFLLGEAVLRWRRSLRDAAITS
jgi:hypothetical protein